MATSKRTARSRSTPKAASASMAALVKRYGEDYAKLVAENRRSETFPPGMEVAFIKLAVPVEEETTAHIVKEWAIFGKPGLADRLNDALDRLFPVNDPVGLIELERMAAQAS